MTATLVELWSAWTIHRDERAFEALVLPEVPHALGFARRLGCNDADAHDALQDALVCLARTPGGPPTRLGVRAWLCREVHTRARAQLRSARRRAVREQAVGRRDAAIPAEPPLDLRDAVERVLAELDDADRRAVCLRYLHDLDYAEAAVVLGTSEGACRLRVHRALAALRARLGAGAGTALASLPLPFVPDGSNLVKAAVGRALCSSGTAATTGVLVMTTVQKVVVAAVVAAAAGVAGTIAVRGSASAPDAAQEQAAAAARDEKIERRLAEFQRRLDAVSRPERRVAGRDAPAAPTDVREPAVAPDGTPYVSHAELAAEIAAIRKVLADAPGGAAAKTPPEKKTIEEIAREMGLSAGEEANLRNILRESEEKMLHVFFGDRPLDEIKADLVAAQKDPEKDAELKQGMVDRGMKGLGALLTTQSASAKKVVDLLGAERAADFLRRPRSSVLGPEFDVIGKTSFEVKTSADAK